MSSKITAKVTQNNIDKILAKIEADMEAIHDEAANKAVALAKKLAPVRTGFMRDSIIVIKSQPMSRIIRAMARYSWFVEYGTRKMAPRPFLAPAMSLYRSIIKQKFGSK